MSKIKVYTKKKKFPVAQDLYGLFFEDINRAGDGGLYPEMLRNRAFEDSILPERCITINNDYGFQSPTGWRDQFNHGEGLKRWCNDLAPTNVPAWYVENASMEVDHENVLNQNRLAALRICFQTGGYIYNIGYRGIFIEKGKKYHFYTFAKSIGKSIYLQLSLESKNGDIYDASKIKIKKDSYNRYDIFFVAGKTDKEAILKITAFEEGTLLLGFTSLMPLDTYKGHGMRKDLMKMLEGTHSKFLRFPGGCIVEGFSKETMMRFPNTIGPVWERPSKTLMWHYRTTNGLGYHEYLQICEDLNLEPLYVVNCGMTCQGRFAEMIEDEELDLLLQEACDAIDYAIALKESNKWAKMRAEAGHPEPFKMKYIEIGNENYGSEYMWRYEKFYRVLKEKYPQLIFISNVHTEREGLETEVVDEHYYSTSDFFQKNQNMFENYDRKGPKIFVGEYAVTSGNNVGDIYSALAETMYLLGIENNQDIVAMTSYAPLFQNVDYTSWYPNLISFDNHRTFAIPLYYAIQMLATNRGEDVLETVFEGREACSKNAGIPGIIAYENGVAIKNVMYNGKKVSVSHKIVGELEKKDKEIYLLIGHNKELLSFPGITENSKEICYITFGEDKSEKIVFEADIKIDSPRIPVAVTLWNSHCPMLFSPDETEERSKEWSPVYTEHYSWIIHEGMGSAQSVHWFQGHLLAEKKRIPVRYGEYMHVKVETRENGFDCYINEILVQTVNLENYPCTAVTASENNGEIIVKIVNMDENTDNIEIEADCSIESEYEVIILQGDSSNAKNTFEEPNKVVPQTFSYTGASQKFQYCAPALSFSILKLCKKIVYD